jgi:hypothetical protein
MKMLPNRSLYISLPVIFIFLLVISLRFLPVSGTVAETEDFRVLLKVDLLDYYTNVPVRNVNFQVEVKSRGGETFSTLMFSGDYGAAIVELPSNFSSSDLFLSRISLSGIWIIEKVAGRGEYDIAFGRWSPINLEKLPMNITEYMINNVFPSSEQKKFHVIIKF